MFTALFGKPQATHNLEKLEKAISKLEDRVKVLEKQPKENTTRENTTKENQAYLFLVSELPKGVYTYNCVVRRYKKKYGPISRQYMGDLINKAALTHSEQIKVKKDSRPYTVVVR